MFKNNWYKKLKNIFSKVSSNEVKIIEVESSLEREVFFPLFRPLAVLLKIFGVFPLQNVCRQDGSLLRYRVVSVDFFWGIILYTIPTILNAILEDDKWFSLMMPYYISRTALVISLCHYYDRLQPDLVRLIGDFDRSCNKMSIKIPTYKCNRGIVWSTLIILVILSLLLIIVPKRMSMGDYIFLQSISMGVMGSLPLFPRMLYLSAFLFYCYSLKTRFEVLSSHWKILMNQSLNTEYVESAMQFKFTVTVDLQLEKFRILHRKLCNTIKKLNDAYGCRLLLFFVTVFLDLLHDVYVYCYVIQLRGSMQIIFALMNTATLYAATAVPASLEESALLLQQDLHEASLSKIDFKSQFQAQLIMLARPIHISAAGFCKVNKTLLMTMFLTLATYLVMLGQFNSSIQKLID